MSEPYFIWDGIDSRTMGIVVQQYPGYQRAKERVTTVTIPGRQGALTIPESTSERIFDTMLMNCKCAVRPGANIANICAWLQGDGLAVFGHQPNYAYQARIINAIPFEAFCKDPHGWYTFTIPFECQPLKQANPPLADLRIYTGSNNGSKTVNNEGSVRVPLKATVYGGGTLGIYVTKDGVTTAAYVTGAVNGVIFDWEAQEAFYLDAVGGIYTVATKYMTVYRNGVLVNEALYLEPGNNTVGWQNTSGGTVRDVTVARNWRWIG